MCGNFQTGWVNPRVLRSLREQAGLTVAAVAEASRELERKGFTRVEAATLMQWEEGRGEPEVEHLETLSELYGCPVGHFFLSEVPEERLPLSFRGLAPEKEKHFSYTTRASLRRFVDLAGWFTALIEEHNLDWKVTIPLARGGIREPGRVAKLVRERCGFTPQVRRDWSSAQDAFDWWRYRIEAQGVFCFELKLDPQDVRGASLWVKGRYPFILVNRRDVESATGRLFTLLHEYSHLVLSDERVGITCDSLGRQEGIRMEAAANQSAANTLLDLGELEEHVRKNWPGCERRNWPDRTLDEIGRVFFVSRHVVAIALESCGLAPPGFYAQRRERWGRRAARVRPFGRGGSQKKTVRKARELGRSAVRVLSGLHERRALPLLDAAEFLETKVDKLDRFVEELAQHVTSMEVRD